MRKIVFHFYSMSRWGKSLNCIAGRNNGENQIYYVNSKNVSPWDFFDGVIYKVLLLRFLYLSAEPVI